MALLGGPSLGERLSLPRSRLLSRLPLLFRPLRRGGVIDRDLDRERDGERESWRRRRWVGGGEREPLELDRGGVRDEARRRLRDGDRDAIFDAEMADLCVLRRFNREV